MMPPFDCVMNGRVVSPASSKMRSKLPKYSSTFFWMYRFATATHARSYSRTSGHSSLEQHTFSCGWSSAMMRAASCSCCGVR